MNTEEFTKAFEQLAEMWKKATAMLVESAEALNKAFEKCGDDAKSDKAFEKRVHTKRIEVHHCKKYDYIPVVRKNLPYQRRNY